ncbi:hypothetical protein [Acidocella sp.]|jgi:uncharacterized protein YcfJ|uniref:hypothetical protein n=1 Tax=Acidocella sp. TaxID=50710 RepID=UPI002F428D74
MTLKFLSLTAAVMVGLAAFGTSQAQAIGCVSGGAAGAVAGHYAGHHAVMGAIAGCVAGHEIAKHRAEQEHEVQRAHNTDGQRSL